MELKFAVVYVLLSLAVALGHKMPPEFKICNKDDPEINKCLKEAVSIAIPLLKDGLSELNVQPVEPLLIESLTISSGTPSVKLDQNFRNMRIHHLTEIEVKDSKFSENGGDYLVVVDAIMPTCHIDSDYDFDGKILSIPIVGKGKCFIELEETKTKLTMEGTTVQKKGVDFIKLEKVTVDLAPKEAHFQFDNLFNGDKALGDNMNKLINDNWKDLFDEVKGTYIEAFGAVVKNQADNIFNKVPSKDLFPTK